MGLDCVKNAIPESCSTGAVYSNLFAQLIGYQAELDVLSIVEAFGRCEGELFYFYYCEINFTLGAFSFVYCVGRKIQKT